VAEPTQIAHRQRRPLLSFVLASIAVNAALGIYALVVPHFGGLEARILATSASITGAGVLVLACLPARERRFPLLPAAGIVLSILGFGLIVAGIWSRTESGPLWQTAWALLVMAVWCALMSVLSLVRLAAGHRWVFASTLLVGGLLAAMIDAAIWTEPSSGWYGRATGVVAVLFAAAALALPIVHRVDRAEREGLAPLEICVRFCPSCGCRQPLATGEGTICRSCGARFEVRFLAG
jgi:hypothetical protein